MYILKLVVLIGILDTECLRKAVTEVMAGSGLKRLTVVHQRLDGVGGLCSGELLLVGLLSLDYRDRQNLFTEVCINIQHLNGSCLCLFLGCMSRVALLP